MVQFTGLTRVLKDAGVAYTLVPGWESRTAHAGGIRENRATFWHTTESTDATFRAGGNCPTLGYVVDGLGYPLYNLLIGRNGHVYLVAAGTAAHAGEGSISGIPTDNGNRYALSVSFDANNKGYPVTAAQLESGARIGAAIDRDWGRAGKGRHIMHGEWAPSRRSDPTRIPGGWPALRAAIKRGHWNTPSSPPTKPTASKPEPKPEPPKEWTDMATEAEVTAAGRAGALKALTEDEVIPWTDSVTGKESKITLAKAIGNLSVLGHRELARDTAKEA